MRTELEVSQVEYFPLPTFSLFDDNWGRRSHKWVLCLYWWKWCLYIRF